MNYGAIAAFGVAMFLVITSLLISPHAVFAGDSSYVKSQSASQSNECGNYWFPVKCNIVPVNHVLQPVHASTSEAVAAAAGDYSTVVVP